VGVVRIPAFGENGQARAEILKDPVILRLRVKP
jgi:hypothetical protein